MMHFLPGSGDDTARDELQRRHRSHRRERVMERVDVVGPKSLRHVARGCSKRPDTTLTAAKIPRRRSAATCSRRLSVVNCCNAPTPPAVRMMATRSPGSICVSMYL